MFRHVIPLLSLALVTTSIPIAAQCAQPQGNAKLAISGLPRPGQSLTFLMNGKPAAPFLIAIDGTKGPTPLPWGGNLCLSPNFYTLFFGSSIPASGEFRFVQPLPSNMVQLIPRDQLNVVSLLAEVTLDSQKSL